MIEEPECNKRQCKHFLGIKHDEPGPEDNERPYCLAFPDGIPSSIAYGENKHLEPLEGQGNDIVYEKKTEDDA